MFLYPEKVRIHARNVIVLGSGFICSDNKSGLLNVGGEYSPNTFYWEGRLKLKLFDSSYSIYKASKVLVVFVNRNKFVILPKIFSWDFLFDFFIKQWYC